MATQIELIKKYGLSVRGAIGQHLLIDPNIQRKIVDLLDPKPGETVLEIGPGLGALTGEILKAGSHVVAVEKDPGFAEVLKMELADYIPGHFNLFNEDILHFDFREALLQPEQSIKVVSNLPYYITAPILFYLSHHADSICEAILMMQKEVANRLCAQAGSKDYGRLTLAMRICAEIHTAFQVPATCFTPQPEVDSTVLRMTFHKHPSIGDKEQLLALIKVAFSQRRKALPGLLAASPELSVQKDKVVAHFKKKGISPTVRAEELLLKDFIELAEALDEL